MKVIYRYPLIAGILFFAAVIVRAQDDGVISVDNFQLQRITNGADFEFINYNFYSDEDSYKGKIVSVSGVFVHQPVIGKGKRKFVQLIGSGVNGPVNIIIYIDNELSTRKVYGNDVPVFTNGLVIRAFVQLTGAANFVNNSGSWLYLPTGDGLLFFAKDDTGFRFPMWASNSLKRR